MPIRRALALLLTLAAACATANRPAASDLDTAYRNRDFFGLRDRLAANPSAAGDERDFFTAAVANAFNRLDDAHAAVARARTTAPATRRLDLLRLALDNAQRRGAYREGRAVAEEILAGFPNGEKSILDDVRNTLRMMTALGDAAPQRVTIHGPTSLTMSKNAMGGRELPVTIDGTPRAYIVDSGANYSVLMRSEADALGLEVRAAGLDIGVSTGAKITADLAVAKRMTIGNAELENVVFLVMPDSFLTFSDGAKIPGIIGYPVLNGLHEIRVHRDGTLAIPEQPRAGSEQNLANNESDLLVQARAGQSLVRCRFDSGAAHTMFYVPFFEANREMVLATGKARKANLSGLGSERAVDAYKLPLLSMRVGGFPITLHDADVFSAPLGAEREPIDCNLAHDAFDQAAEYDLNFDAMTLVLR
jgi:predicted aspartyl protease